MNPRWLDLMVRTGRKVNADVVIVRDLPLAPTAVRAGRKLGVPVIMDMAENYPAMIRDVWLQNREFRIHDGDPPAPDYDALLEEY